jgi:hypothetical protein
MPEHIQYQDDDLFNPETHHEESDVPVKPLLWSLVLFVVFGAITHIALWGFYKLMLSAEQRRWDPPQTAVARPASADVPQNQPLLQPFRHDEKSAPFEDTPVTDLIKMRTAEEKVLKHYGWVDKQRGIVHIPIERAIELYAAQQAVQAQTAAPTAQPTPTTPAPATTTAPTTTTAPIATAPTTTGGAH